MCGPSRNMSRLGVRTSDWYIVLGGDGFQTRHDPDDPNIVYASSQNGGVARVDLRAGTSQRIRPTIPPPGPDGVTPIAQQQPQQGGGRGGGRGGGPGADRVNWDAPYIISPHSSRRLYRASQYVYRTDDRGDSWTRISPDLSRDLDAFNIPIMGKVWPRDSIALNQRAPRGLAGRAC